MGWIGCVRCKKIRSKFVARTFALASARCAPSFVRQPNGLECTQIVQNAPKRQFRVQWGGSAAFTAKNSDATLCYELLHLFGLFCTEFHKPTKLSQMQPNSTKTQQKHEFTVPRGGSGAFVVKNSDATSWHELLH